MSNKFEQTGFLFGSNAVFIEELYKLYLENPLSVDQSWQEFFSNFDQKQEVAKTTAKIIFPDELAEKKGDSKDVKSLTQHEGTHLKSSAAEFAASALYLKALFMISSYRQKGHLLAKIDPLGLEKTKTKSDLKLNIEDFGFTASDLDSIITLNGEFAGIKECTVSDLVNLLDKTYCSSIAAEFNHIEDQLEQKWLQDQLESFSAYKMSEAQSKEILQDLVKIEGFEQYIHTKFPGAKRFSIEGGDTSIVALKKMIELSGDNGVADIVIGMAHRGRLCTLTNVMNKPYRAVFSEFMGTSAFPSDIELAGDVKYHMGYSSDITGTKNNQIHLSLTPNPSHLEAVNPVVAGKVRAKQDLPSDPTATDRKSTLGILIHGDAAFCGQGIVAECLAMSGLKAYNVGGILHIVINNQIGFTANAADSRVGRYATEVAKIAGAPILHVNGEDIEAVVFAAMIAANYRHIFGKDFVLDVVCYRKYGHNEGDEPMYTQGKMYNIIKEKLTPGNIYANSLVKRQIISQDHFAKLKEEFKTKLDSEYKEAKNYKPHAQWLEGMWQGYVRSSANKLVETGVKASKLQELAIKLASPPADFALNAKLDKLFKQRIIDLQNNQPIDWAIAEQLAFASLLTEGVPVRLTGQDCGRGTFSHRHSVLHSQVDDGAYMPLNNLSQDQAKYFVADSNLSEYGVLGFEYGYSLVNPKHLVIWEAQFGDFANGAQIMFDQFISSSETKWLRMSGLVVLLPHGFEGQGPEHSSARLERFLQLAAEDNMKIVYPTTPASIFHLLRRQIHSDERKPLIVMTPKSLLRHKLAVSSLAELDAGTSFKMVLDDAGSGSDQLKIESVNRLIFCSGKIYYDLFEKRLEAKLSNTAIVRLEQLYPVPIDDIKSIIGKYNKAQEFIWCQEEPENMGAWQFMQNSLNNCLEQMNIKNRFKYVGRQLAASPAVGSLYVHSKQQEKLVKQALNIGE